MALAQTSHATLILDYNFNQTGTTVTNGGSAGAGANLTFQNSSFVATDLHGAPGSGVSGLFGDRAFDNSASTGMGNAGTGGRGVTSGPISVLSGLDSMTIAGWFNVSTVIGGNARLLDSLGSGLGFNLYASGAGILSLQVDGAVATSSASYGATGSWVFFAVTYDGTLTSNNAKFYVGTTNTAVSLVNTATLNQGELGTSGVAVGVGNAAQTTNRPVDGLMDNIQLYGEATGSGGVLSLSELDAVRLSAVPEPGSLTLAGFSLLGIVLAWRRRKVDA